MSRVNSVNRRVRFALTCGFLSDIGLIVVCGIILLVFMDDALAVTPLDPASPAPSVTQTQEQAATADSTSEATSESTSSANGGAGGEALSSSTASTGSIAAAFEYDSRALGLAFAPAIPVQIDSSLCTQRTTRSFDVKPLPFAMSGNIKRDRGCLAVLLAEEQAESAHQRCIDVVRMYVAIELREAAARQLVKCGGVEIALVEPELRRTVMTPSDVQERIDRAFRAAQAK